MLPDPKLFASLLTEETGLPLIGSRIRHAGNEEIELVPSDHEPSQSFRLRTTLGWKSVEVSFEPGAYASALVASMSIASEEAKLVCQSVLQSAIADGADVTLVIDGIRYSSTDREPWDRPWSTCTASLSRGQLDINNGDNAADMQLLLTWTARLAAAMFALLPLAPDEEEVPQQLSGYPEGAMSKAVVNRYERDRRNRAAALAIHGYRCKACDCLMAEKYGLQAATLVEVHHTTPVHALGAVYLINPRTDLVPLCPNCHSVVHTRNPPLSIEEIRTLLGIQ